MSADRAALQKEVSALKTEINRIADTTQFAGQNLLDGKFSEKFLVGANAGQNISIALGTSLNATGLNFATLPLGIAPVAPEGLPAKNKPISLLAVQLPT